MRHVITFGQEDSRTNNNTENSDSNDSSNNYSIYTSAVEYTPPQPRTIMSTDSYYPRRLPISPSARILRARSYTSDFENLHSRIQHATLEVERNLAEQDYIRRIPSSKIKMGTLEYGRKLLNQKVFIAENIDDLPKLKDYFEQLEIKQYLMNSMRMSMFDF